MRPSVAAPALKMARWLFPAYLAIFAVLVVPIALAGLSQFSGQSVNPDNYVLALPIAFDRDALTVLAFLGGFSAATGMVIVATVALAIMVSNDIVMPLILRSGLVRSSDKTDLSQTLLRVRRVSILIVTLVAYAYYQAIEAGVPLASIGLLSFSAAAQFAPAMLIGLYWTGASRLGALAGLSTGVTAWFVLLLLPSFAEAWSMTYGKESTETALSWLVGSVPLIEHGCLGHIPEVLDGDYPHTPGGCDAQAWGASELLRVWLKLS